MRRNFNPQPPTTPARATPQPIEQQIDVLIDLVHDDLLRPSITRRQRRQALPHIKRDFNIILQQISTVQEIEAILNKLEGNEKINSICLQLNKDYRNPYAHRGQVPVIFIARTKFSPAEKLILLIEKFKEQLRERKFEIQITTCLHPKNCLFSTKYCAPTQKRPVTQNEQIIIISPSPTI